MFELAARSELIVFFLQVVLVYCFGDHGIGYTGPTIIRLTMGRHHLIRRLRTEGEKRKHERMQDHISFLLYTKYGCRFSFILFLLTCLYTRRDNFFSQPIIKIVKVYTIQYIKEP